MFDLFYRYSRKEITSGINLSLKREIPYLRMFDEKEETAECDLKALCYLRNRTIILKK